MAIILDADVVIRGEKGTFDLAVWVASLPDERFELASITVAELWRGVERATGAQRKRRQRYLQTVLNTVPVLPYTELTAYEQSRIWAGLESAGERIGFYDIIVAATAIERGSRVATFNKKHFARVPGLEVIEPA